MTQSKIELVRLADLLFMEEGPDIGTLATAIERHGIWGWDRFQRFVYMPPPKPGIESTNPARDRDCSAVLDLLAAESRRRIDAAIGATVAYLRNKPVPDLSIEFNWDLQPYGWKPNELPDFAAIQAEQDPSAPAQMPEIRELKDNGKRDAGLYRIIGALLHIMAGDDDMEPHPLWERERLGDPDSFDRVVKCLAQRWHYHPGMKERTIKDHLRQALETLGMEPGRRPAIAKRLRSDG